MIDYLHRKAHDLAGLGIQCQAKDLATAANWPDAAECSRIAEKIAGFLRHSDYEVDEFEFDGLDLASVDLFRLDLRKLNPDDFKG